MGIVPETANAYVDLSAWNNIMLTGELYGIPKKDRQTRGEKLLKEVGLHQRKARARAFFFSCELSYSDTGIPLSFCSVSISSWLDLILMLVGWVKF
jgi:hypothetical protein